MVHRGLRTYALSTILLIPGLQELDPFLSTLYRGVFDRFMGGHPRVKRYTLILILLRQCIDSRDGVSLGVAVNRELKCLGHVVVRTLSDSFSCYL